MFKLLINDKNKSIIKHIKVLTATSKLSNQITPSKSTIIRQRASSMPPSIAQRPLVRAKTASSWPKSSKPFIATGGYPVKHIIVYLFLKKNYCFTF